MRGRALFGAAFLALVVLAPTLIGFRDLADSIGASPSSRPPIWAGTQALFALQQVLFSVGVSCGLLSIILASYHSSVVRRLLHIGSLTVLLELFYRFAYGGSVSAGVMLSVGETSRRESWELIAGHPVLSTSLSLVLIAACYTTVSTWSARYRFAAATYVPLAILALLLNTAALAIVSYEARGPVLDAGIFGGQFKGLFPFDVVTAAQALALNAWDAHESASLRRNFRFPNAHRVSAANASSAREIYFIVIGETSRRRNWSLFGYPRDTTPRLNALRSDLVLFDHITSNATNTIQSLPLALSRATTDGMNRFHSEKSIVGLLRQAGFETFWMSNQERSNSPSNAVSQIAFEAGHVSFSDDPHRESNGPKLDSVLLTRVDAALKSLPPAAKAVFFLHMEGSHFNYADRYPVQSRRFAGNDPPTRPLSERQGRLVDEYDNSIVYTDEMLGQMIRRLSDCSCRSGLLYFSDHGERLFDKGLGDPEFGHGFPSVARAEIEVPFFLFLSSVYQESNGSLVASLRANTRAAGELHNVFETIVDLTGVDYDGRRADLSLFSGDFKSPSVRKVLDVNQRSISLPIDDYVTD